MIALALGLGAARVDAKAKKTNTFALTSKSAKPAKARKNGNFARSKGRSTPHAAARKVSKSKTKLKK